MKLADLMVNQKIVVQILWGERKIEFDTEVKGKEEKGVGATLRSVQLYYRTAQRPRHCPGDSCLCGGP